MKWTIDISQVVSVFVTLFILIDVIGSVPIFLGLQGQGRKIKPFGTAFFSFLIMAVFLFVGETILTWFHVDVHSFAVAGGLIMFVIAIEMVFGVEIFKNDAPGGNSTFVPIVFPLIAGPASFTALLTMRADNSFLSILVGVFINMIVVYVVLRFLDKIQNFIGASGVYVARKFFGIILMAIGVGIVTNNILKLIKISNLIP